MVEVLGELEALLMGAVAAVGYELWGAEVINTGRIHTLRVYIDADKGINIDDCAKASRQISAVLEVEDPVASAYTLEVSSPGLRRPLYTLDQYKGFIAQPIKLRLKQANVLNRKNFSGILMKADTLGIGVEVDGEQYVFELADIASAHLNPTI